MGLRLVMLAVLATAAFAADEYFYVREDGSATYTDPQTAYDDIPSTLAANTTYWVVMDHADEFALTTLTLTRTFTWGSGSKIVFLGEGQGAHDEGSGGASIVCSGTNAVSITAQASSNYEFQQLRFGYSGSTNTTAVFQVNNLAGAGTLRVSRVWAEKSGTTGNSNSFVYMLVGNGSTAIVDNSSFIDKSASGDVTGGVRLDSILGASGVTVRVYNTVINSVQNGIDFNGPGAFTTSNCYVRNVVYIDCGTVFDGISGVTADRDFEAANTTGTTGATYNVDSIAEEDYFNVTTWQRIAYSKGVSELDELGDTVGDDYATDISGTVRIVPWSLGAKELENDPVILAPTRPEQQDWFFFMSRNRVYRRWFP